MAGHTEPALDELNAAISDLDGPDRAFAVFQRATVMNRVGRVAEASAGYDESLAVFRACGITKHEAYARTNRALLRAYGGDLRGADHDLAVASRLYERLGLRSLAATALHNQGFVATRRGDLPRALRHFEAAAAIFTALGQSPGAMSLDHCEALIAAGLTAEARLKAEAVAQELLAGGNEADAGEALLCAAHAALESGARDEAAGLCAAARRLFAAQHRGDWMAAAALLDLRVRLLADGPSSALSAESDEIAAELERLGQAGLAVQARLIAAGAEPDPSLGLARLRGTRFPMNSGVELQFQRVAIEADVRYRGGDRAGASRCVTAGTKLVERYRRAFGALELRAHIGTHAEALSELGRRMAWERRNAAQLFRRIEQSRGGALRQPPTTPPEDPELSGLLEQLRGVTSDLAGVSHDRADRLEQEQRRLQALVQARLRHLPGTGQAIPIVNLDELRRELSHGLMIVLAGIDHTLVSVALTPSKVHVSSLGHSSVVARSVESLELAQRRLARRTTSALSRRLAVDTCVEELVALDRVFATALSGIDTRFVVFVPPAALQRIPFGLLPSFRPYEVSVSPSATAWWHARLRPPVSSSQVAAIAGPQLRRAKKEVRAVATTWPAAVELVGRQATVARTLGAFQSSRVLHLAAHYGLRDGNPLFASISVSKGPVYLHDVAAMGAAPETVVLAGCGSGLGSVSTSDDLLGFVNALLTNGTRSVIASTNLIPDDDVTCDVMVDLHRRLRRGAGPALAVRDALATRPEADRVARPLTCFGAG
jgi:hypothetical protein